MATKRKSVRVDNVVPTTNTVEETLESRNAIYGDFQNVAEVSQDIKGCLVCGNSYINLNPGQREALDMIANKLARIVCGDPNYKDSWHDIQGYGKLGEDSCVINATAILG